ncbi:dephospho-CoA kinase [Xenorhabdus nematophila]|uniref:Dephospho-CoA kinase n=1 Tax=Xenorhabdus nematophila (strain ATCC 19061 / DSM 3370 / CCUG 14189 / LMG 1036 / NCIMB 9965 / AN6) TaxID=406817 RepID=D3V8U6_XENNA|nr:dephospho-CoA kinase [Xenorhabdus nematophila]CEE93655.1 dephospho-CoA kinase [Xenorhabdus nematophila str. Anatoliense]CEF30840.1 dephospho-CoA kinase [Xenorhabdus nematophila str. Websteri]AYA40886.1 dephospho-CoA kinase [Xenorhabdus nematophila]MBA0019634.1 dephospho-CoA kinase [Xenorhabdus nematophila]MCB4423991.1 dephospho-CoA kinase [Xenorhabdus nematophila]
MTYIVALTGGIGSGKTTISNVFSSLGVPLVDADIIAREVVAPGTPALQSISEHFGPEILLPDGNLNRILLRQKIFATPAEKQWLNALLHPLIQAETQRQLNQITAPYVIWVVPLLIENNLIHLADRILVVDVLPEVQIERTMARDGVNRQQVENILAAQANRQDRLEKADDVIFNHHREQDIVSSRVVELHQQYLKQAESVRQEKP